MKVVRLSSLTANGHPTLFSILLLDFLQVTCSLTKRRRHLKRRKRFSLFQPSPLMKNKTTCSQIIDLRCVKVFSLSFIVISLYWPLGNSFIKKWLHLFIWRRRRKRKCQISGSLKESNERTKLESIFLAAKVGDMFIYLLPK